MVQLLRRRNRRFQYRQYRNRQFQNRRCKNIYSLQCSNCHVCVFQALAEGSHGPRLRSRRHEGVDMNPNDTAIAPADTGGGHLLTTTGEQVEHSSLLNPP